MSVCRTFSSTQVYTLCRSVDTFSSTQVTLYPLCNCSMFVLHRLPVVITKEMCRSVDTFSSTQVTLYLVSVCRHVSTRFVGLILPLCNCSMFVLHRLPVVITKEMGRNCFIPTVVPRWFLEVSHIFSDRRVRSVLSGTVKFVFIM